MQKEISYDINGQIVEKSHYNVAKHVIDDRYEAYYIKYFNFGPQRTTPVNPYGVGFSIKQLVPDGPMGSMASYQEVSKECFNMYIKFLETKNELFHRQAMNLKGGF